MDVELIEIREFLAGVAPFDTLPGETLDTLPRQLSVRYLRRGTPFPPPDADAAYLYVVRSGAIELRDQGGMLTDKLGEGDHFASPCLAADDSALIGHTVEDSLLYLLPCERWRTLCDRQPQFSEFFHRSEQARLRHALDQLQGAVGTGAGLTGVAVAQLVERTGTRVTPETTIGEAARQMSAAGVSALLVTTGDRLDGIVTDQDFRARGIAAGVSPDAPIATIMSRNVATIASSALGFEALMQMTRRNINHLPVMEDERAIGIITTPDLLRYQSANSVFLAAEVHRAPSPEALAETARLLPELQVQLSAAGVTARHLGEAVSAVTDAITCRLLQLAEAQLGPPPIAYAWLACGSQARHEQTIHSDQDNALLLSDAYRAEHAGWFEQLARFVNEGLRACGFPFCPGEVMASTLKWRQPRAVWKRYFDDWIDNPERKALMHASIFFDLRIVHGDQALYDELHHYVLDKTRDNRIFLAHLVANAVRSRPPLGFFRNFVLVHDGEHDETLDLKRGAILPITDLARIHALAAGVGAINTRDRLRAATAGGALSSEGATSLEDALEFIATLRFRHQAQQLMNGERPDNFVAPERLSPLERTHLKDVFSTIATLQKAVAQRYQSERFF